MNKIYDGLAQAVSEIKDGSTIMIGGFGGAGAPVELMHAVIDSRPQNLTLINNNAGNGHIGMAAMVECGLVSKIICSFPRSRDASVFTELYQAGGIELELIPQGTLAERIRAGGAGIPAFYTPAGYGTELAKGKPVAEFSGKMCVQERWLKADFALIKAENGDEFGNLTYRKAARNFNPLMATAANQTIAQVSRIVEVGRMDPEVIVTPGIYVDRVVEVQNPNQEEMLNLSGSVYPRNTS